MALLLLAANNAQSVLAAGISSSATTLTLTTGTGSLFPSPVSGASFFKLTLIDAATGTINEIVHVTARTGDTLTITRAQEGTVARAWSVNDIAANMMTAGTLNYILTNYQPLIPLGGIYTNVVTFGVSGTYTWPADVKFIEVIVTGAGGGGGGCNATTTSDTYFGAGGGGGGTAFGLIRATDPGAGPGTYAVTVGLGGTGGSGAAPGSDGGDSVFMSLTGGGGKGAKRPTADNTSGGTGGSASGGYQRVFGAFGQDGQSTTRSISGNGGGSFWGGGGISSNLAAPIARGSVGDGGGGAYDMLFRGVSGSGANGGNGVVVIKEYR